MEEIFETLRKQIKGGFDQNNIIIILDNSISLTCKKHPISGTNNSIIIIQPYLIDIIEKTGIQSISMYEQYQMIAVYQNQIPRTRIQLQLPHKVQNSETKNTEPNRTRIPTTNQEPNPIQPNK